MYFKTTFSTLIVSCTLLLASSISAHAQTSTYTIGNMTDKSVKTLRIRGWKVLDFDRIKPGATETFTIENDGGNCVTRVSIKFSGGDRDDRNENVCKPKAGVYIIGH
jgi:hypothetical protein